MRETNTAPTLPALVTTPTCTFTPIYAISVSPAATFITIDSNTGVLSFADTTSTTTYTVTLTVTQTINSVVPPDLVFTVTY